MQKIDLSIIIVSWNVKSFLEKCLNSIKKHNHKLKSEIIVIDNASEDETVEFIEKNFSDVILIPNKANLGFSRANNIGIKQSTGKYIVFLNPDTLLMEASFDVMVNAFESNENIGAVGCKLVDDEGRIDFHCAKNFPTINNLIFEPYLSKMYKTQINKFTMHDWNHEDNRYVEVLSGACLMVQREILDKAGYFDEDIFMYVDDVELCYRIKKSGWNILYLAETAIVHYGQQSVKQKYVEMSAENIRSMRKFFRKHKSLLYGMSFETLIIFEYLLKSYLLSIFNLFKPKHTHATIQNYRSVALELIRRP